MKSGSRGRVISPGKMGGQRKSLSPVVSERGQKKPALFEIESLNDERFFSKIVLFPADCPGKAIRSSNIKTPQSHL